MELRRLIGVSSADFDGHEALIPFAEVISARAMTGLGFPVALPHIATKPVCGMGAVAQLSQYLVDRVEVLSNMDGIELIWLVIREGFLFEGIAGVISAGMEIRPAVFAVERRRDGTQTTGDLEHILDVIVFIAALNLAGECRR
jgi:hypothetical protein